MKRIRVSYNLKPETIELVKLASEIFNENMSKIVEDALNFRLSFIIAKGPKKRPTKESLTSSKDTQKAIDDYWAKILKK